MLLSDKAANERLIFVDKLTLPEVSTKQMNVFLSSLPSNGRPTLIAQTESNHNLQLSSRNLPSVRTDISRNLNVSDLLRYEYLVMAVESIDSLTEQLTN